MKTPQISIMMLTYNRARFLPEAVESVLAQNFNDWELLTIDDASTDDTEKLVGEYVKKDARIKYFKNQINLNISKSRNRALNLAQGKYIAVLDSDDIWCDENKLIRQYSFLEKNQDYVLIGGGRIIIDENGCELKRTFGTQGDNNLKRNILIKNPFTNSAVMFRKSVAVKVGGYGDGLDGIEDYDLFLRLGAEGRMENLKELIVKYRVHSANITLEKRSELMKQNLRLIKKYDAHYPNFYFALCRRKVRLFLYEVLSFPNTTRKSF